MTVRTSRLLGCIIICAVVIVIVASRTRARANDQAENRTVPKYTSDGKLMRPANYREWVFLASGLGMNYGPSAAGATGPANFTNVFVNPESYREFMKSGKWPDKTMFALEIYTSGTHRNPMRNGNFQDSLAGIEFNVKDSAFPEGWRFFNFSGDNTTGDPIPKEASCLTCHSKNAAVENSFGQFYPTVLKVAQEKGTIKPGINIPISAKNFAELVKTKGLIPAEQAYQKDKTLEDFSITENALNAEAYHYLTADTQTAVTLFEFITKEYPDSPNAWDSLADGYAQQNRKSDAKAATEKALALLAKAKVSETQKQAIINAAKARLENLK
jgi:hypothetical protein